MASEKAHSAAGMTAGGIAAFARSGNQEPINQLAEALGGVIGGRFGGRLPDMIEPAIHSWHRGPAHSVTMGAGLLASAGGGIAMWETDWRARAASFAERKTDPRLSEAERLLYGVVDLSCRIAAGLAVGLVAGYLSHLALDAGTPRSIPLLKRGL